MDFNVCFVKIKTNKAKSVTFLFFIISSHDKKDLEKQ